MDFMGQKDVSYNQCSAEVIATLAEYLASNGVSVCC